MSRRALLWKSGLAGAQVVSGGLAALGVVPLRVVGLLVLVVAGLQAATTFYEHGVATVATVPTAPTDGRPSAG